MSKKPVEVINSDLQQFISQPDITQNRYLYKAKVSEIGNVEDRERRTEERRGGKPS